MVRRLFMYHRSMVPSSCSVANATSSALSTAYVYMRGAEKGACAPLLIENLFERDVDGLIDRDEIAAFDRRAGADASR